MKGILIIAARVLILTIFVASIAFYSFLCSLALAERCEAAQAHLLLGLETLEYVSKELNLMQAEFAKWEAVTRSTNFD
jgi:hypothetical protein